MWDVGRRDEALAMMAAAAEAGRTNVFIPSRRAAQATA